MHRQHPLTHALACCTLYLTHAHAHAHTHTHTHTQRDAHLHNYAHGGSVWQDMIH